MVRVHVDLLPDELFNGSEQADILDRAKADDRDPMTSAFIFGTHLYKWNPKPVPPKYISDAIDGMIENVERIFTSN